MKLSCSQARTLIERWFDGSLSVEDELALEQHAASCPRCGPRLATARRLREGLEGLPEPPAMRIDVDDFVARVGARLDAHAPSRDASSSVWRRTIVRVGLPVGLAAGLVLALTLRGSGEARDPGGVVGESDMIGAGAPGERAHEEDSGSDSASDAASVSASFSGAPTQPPGPRAPAPIAANLPLTDYDSSRHAEAAKALVTALRSASAAAPFDVNLPGAATAFAEVFEAETRDLSLAGWPVVELARGVLADAPAAEATLAARYLGLRADELTLGGLERAARRADQGEAAVAALVDAEGARSLARLVASPETSAVTVLVLARAKTRTLQRFAEEIEPADFPARGIDPEGAGALVELLVGSGAEGARALLRLGLSARLAPGVVAAALVRTSGAGQALVERLAGGRVDRRGETLLLRCAAALGTEDALPWVVERARHGDAAACETLAQLDGLAPVWSMLELESQGRLRDRRAGVDGESAWRRLAAHDPARLARAAQVLLQQDASAATDLLGALVRSESVAAAEAVAILCASSDVPARLRERGLLALAELGESGAELPAELVPHLAALFARLGRREEGLAAAVLLALAATAHEPDAPEGQRAADAGHPAVRLALAEQPARVRERVLAYADAPRGLAARHARIEHELAPVLGALDPSNRRLEE